MKNSVLDASSAILLYKADLFHELLVTYQIVLADSVYAELTRAGYPGTNAFATSRADNIITVHKTPQGVPQRPASLCGALSSLDRGERDTIFCYMAGGGGFIITDDGDAARYCRENSIPFMNALLFPRILSYSQRVSEAHCKHLTESLLSLGRYSRPVIDFAAQASREDLAHFLP